MYLVFSLIPITVALLILSGCGENVLHIVVMGDGAEMALGKVSKDGTALGDFKGVEAIYNNLQDGDYQIKVVSGFYEADRRLRMAPPPLLGSEVYQVDFSIEDIDPNNWDIKALAKENSASIVIRLDDFTNALVEYGLDTGYGQVVPSVRRRSSFHNVELDGLKSNTIYHYRVRSIDFHGGLSSSEDYTLHTLGVSPPLLSAEWGRDENDPLLPLDVAVDMDGNVYVLDSVPLKAKWKVMKFSPDGTFISSFGQDATGSEDGMFNSPDSLTIDDVGNVYVLDTGNNRVQKFASDGTFMAKWGESGSETGQFTLPRGIALDGQANVYVADTGNNRVQKFAPDGTSILAWGESGVDAGQFVLPRGILVDDLGNVFVADTGNNRIQKFNSEGLFVTAWGNKGSDNGELSSPVDLGLDGMGGIYVLERGNNRIQKFSSDGVFDAKWGYPGSEVGELSVPEGMGLTSGGDLYIADSGNNRVQKLDGVGVLSIYLGPGGVAAKDNSSLYLPMDIAVGKGGDIFVLDSGNSRVSRFNGSGTSLTTWGKPGSGDGDFNQPTGISVDGNGDVFVLDTGNFRVQKFSADGTFIAKWGTAGTEEDELDYPTGITIGNDGDIYLADQCQVKVFGREGDFKRMWKGCEFSRSAGDFIPIQDIVGEQSVYLTSDDKLLKFTPEGELISQWDLYNLDNGNRIHPQALALGNSGEVYFVDREGKAARLDEFGNIVVRWGSFDDARGLSIAADGNIYISDTGNHRVQGFKFN